MARKPAAKTPARRAGDLTPKQQRFVAEYLVDLNATQAAIRAGYSAKTAHVIGPENLGKPEVAAAVQEGMAKRSMRTMVTADRVLEEAARLAFADIRGFYRDDGTIKPASEWTADQAAALASVETVEKAGGDVLIRKIKLWDKRATLETLFRHLGLLKDRVEHSVAGGVLVVPAPVDPTAWAAAAAAQQARLVAPDDAAD